MSQLALDLLTTPPPSLENFVVGDNAECLRCLWALRAGDRSHRFVYLWGLPGSGRTHLVRALGLPAQAASGAIGTLHLVDDVQRLEPNGQQRLFEAFLAAAADPARAIVVTGDRPPLALSLRDDLRSRLGSGLVFEIHPLDDPARARALEQAARERGAPLAADLIPWLLTHHSRDMRVLQSMLAALDHYALARQRPLTLPLLREWLARDRRDDPTDKIP